MYWYCLTDHCYYAGEQDVVYQSVAGYGFESSVFVRVRDVVEVWKQSGGMRSDEIISLFRRAIVVPLYVPWNPLWMEVLPS